MTIKQSQYFRDVSQQNKIEVFECQKEGISEEMRQIECGRVCTSNESLLFEEKSTEGSNNQLLILANFAELMSQSEYNLPAAVHQNPQNHEVLDSSMEAQHLQENVNGVMATDNGATNNSDKKWGTTYEMPLISHERNERDGSRGEGTLTRLSHIRCQARRLKSRSFMQQSVQGDTYRCLQGSKIRLTQIRRQARSGMHVPVLHDGAGCSHGKLFGGITRLSQIRRIARSKGNCSLIGGSGEDMHIQSDCKFHEVVADNVNEVLPEKGQLRLSQLRCKVCSGDTDLVAQTTVGKTAEPKCVPIF